MLEIQLTPATIIFLLIIVGLIVIAIKRLTRKGLCDCKDCAGEKTGACQSCSAIDKMLVDMEKAAKNAPK